jgi:hypothetical protein
MSKEECKCESKALSGSKAIEAVKESMGYKDTTECCQVCGSFRQSNAMSGERATLPSRCITNAFWIPVEEDGWCRFFKGQTGDGDLCEADAEDFLPPERRKGNAEG